MQVIDARLGRFFQVGTARLELLLECFNVLNSVNYLASSFVGTMSSPDFGSTLGTVLDVSHNDMRSRKLRGL